MKSEETERSYHYTLASFLIILFIFYLLYMIIIITIFNILSHSSNHRFVAYFSLFY